MLLKLTVKRCSGKLMAAAGTTQVPANTQAGDRFIDILLAQFNSFNFNIIS